MRHRGGGVQVLQVAELTARMRAALEEDPALQDVYVEGEISSCNRAQSGHCYLSLKDVRPGMGDRATVQMLMFRRELSALRFEPATGQHVIAHGQISLYAPNGSVRLLLDHVEPVGVGALAIAFRQLVQRLTAEGLFAAERKRPLPPLPRRLAVVTSPNGAAVRDVIHVIHRRCPITAILVVPTVVQGDAAPAQIVAALQAAVRPGVELVLLVRGGGSLEDLQAFNHEAVARAVAACPLPVVTGVGHETDTTIVDFVADRSAPTPSVAAALAVPELMELRAAVRERQLRLWRGVHARSARRREALAAVARRLDRCAPARRVAAGRQDVDRRALALRRATLSALRLRQEAVRGRQRRLRARAPATRLPLWVAAVRERRAHLRAAFTAGQRERRSQVTAAAGRLEALSPLRVLARGYSLTYDRATGALVRDPAAVPAGSRLRTRLRDGVVDSTVTASGMEGAGDG